MMNKTLIFSGLSLLFLSACGDEKPMSLQYYHQNESEYKKKLAQCEKLLKKGEIPQGNLALNCNTVFQLRNNRISAAFGG